MGGQGARRKRNWRYNQRAYKWAAAKQQRQENCRQLKLQEKQENQEKEGKQQKQEPREPDNATTDGSDDMVDEVRSVWHGLTATANDCSQMHSIMQLACCAIRHA